MADNNRFSCGRKQIEITNILSAAVAVLDEYLITKSAVENYKLYKTKEDNWYEIGDVNTITNNSILRTLKLAIDNDNNEIQNV